jgi:hypothetical protein
MVTKDGSPQRSRAVNPSSFAPPCACSRLFLQPTDPDHKDLKGFVVLCPERLGFQDGDV